MIDPERLTIEAILMAGLLARLPSRGNDQQMRSTADQAVEAADVLLEQHAAGFERRKAIRDAENRPSPDEAKRLEDLKLQEAWKKQNS